MKKFAHTYFPEENDVVIPPKDIWNGSAIAMVYTPETQETTSFQGVDVNISEYDREGYLVLHCNLENKDHYFYKIEHCRYIIQGSFSRSDIALILMALMKGKRQTFFPQQVGLRFQDLANEKENYENKNLEAILSHVEFYTNLNDAGLPGIKRISYTRDVFVKFLQNILKTGYDINTIVPQYTKSPFSYFSKSLSTHPLHALPFPMNISRELHLQNKIKSDPKDTHTGPLDYLNILNTSHEKMCF
jgi:hypothetical protein